MLLSVILPRHFIASACALRSPFCRLTPYWCLGGLNNLNSLRRIDPTIASSSSSATFVYTDFTKKRMVSRAHLFSLSRCTKDPLSESTLLCSQFQISRSYVSSRKRPKTNDKLRKENADVSLISRIHHYALRHGQSQTRLRMRP